MANQHNENDRIKGEGDRNPDPITGAPGSHPVGTGIGAASGGATGAAIGAVGGPIGAVIGAATGAVVGGLIGKGIGEAVDPTTEDSYWRENYSERPYVEEDEAYESYEPLYRYGYTARSHNFDRPYDEVEPELRQDYEQNYAHHGPYEKSKHAIRDAYERPSRADTNT